MRRKLPLPPERPSLRAVLLLFCWGLGSTIVGRSFTAWNPGRFDAQLFAYMGLKWLSGGVPYVDFWDNKPPGLYAVNALVFLLFPKSFTALACTEGVFILGCIGTVYLLTRRWGMPWPVTLLATACAAASCNLAYYNEHGNLTEIYVLWPATLSIYFFGKATPTFQGTWVFLAGFFSGVAALFKPIGFSPLLAQGAFLLHLWAVSRRLSFRHLLISVCTDGAGALVAWLPFALYFWLHDALGELLYASFTYNVHYGVASQGGVLSTPVNAVLKLRPLTSLAACVIVGLVLHAVRGAASPRGRELGADVRRPLDFFWPLVLLWTVFDLAGALAGGRNYPHYFLALAPSLSVAAGFAYWFILEAIPREPRTRGMNKIIFALTIGPLLVEQASDARALHSLLFPGEHPLVRPTELVATHLTTIRGPHDTLFSWDFLPRIFFVTEMKSPTRLLDAHYIFDSAESRRRFAEQTLRDLKRAPPTFIVDGSDRTAPAPPPMTMDQVYEKFREFLDDRYVLIYTAGSLRVYRSLGESNFEIPGQ